MSIFAPKEQPSEDGTSGSDSSETTQTIQFAFHKLDEHWDELEHRIQSCSLGHGDATRPRSVVIDFGLGDILSQYQGSSEGSEETNGSSRSKEQAVCDLLAIEYSPDVWGTSIYCLNLEP